MISKNDGGKHISNWLNVSAANFCRDSNSSRIITFLDILLKKYHNRVIAIFKNTGFIALMAIGRKVVSIT